MATYIGCILVVVRFEGGTMQRWEEQFLSPLRGEQFATYSVSWTLFLFLSAVVSDYSNTGTQAFFVCLLNHKGTIY